MKLQSLERTFSRASLMAFLVLAPAGAYAQAGGGFPADKSASSKPKQLPFDRPVAPPSLRIPRVSRPPSLEDFLHGRSPKPGVRVSDFRQRAPGDGTPASQRTTAYLSYDDTRLYVVFICEDDPSKVRAHMSKREDLLDDDRVSVYIDSFHDRRHAYYFSINPLGVQADGVITEGVKEPDDRFDTLWQARGRLTPQGFAVWFAIPFKSLRFSSASAQTWGIALRRTIVRNGEESYWPYITRRRKSFVQQLATLEGLDAISPGRNIQMIPYGAFTNARLLDMGGPGYRTQQESRFGLDSKVVLHDALTLDVTLNPDFSQVESDDPQVTVNKRYEVLFPEKRPFFIENANYFETPINLFFSRRIIDPEYGARLSGKVGKWTIGALAIDDRAPGQLLASQDPVHGDRALIGVARIQREFGSQSRIGLLTTTREFGSSYSRVFSVDTRLKLSPTWYFTGQLARSYDRDYARNRRLQEHEGPAYYAELLHSSRHLTYASNYQDFSPDFRAPLGFIKRVDVRQAGHYLAYFWLPENSRILSFGPSVSAGTNWNREGRLQDWYVNSEFSMDFAGPAGVKATRYEAYEFYLNHGFRYSTSGGSFYLNSLKWFQLFGGYTQGAGVNYSPASGLAPFLGNSRNGYLGFKLRPSPRARIEQYYYYSQLATRRGFRSEQHQASVFNNHLFRTKINYQFTRALSIRTILDYSSLLPNSSLISSGKYKTLTGDALLTYLVNPGTALYIGYNNRHENLATDPLTPPSLRRYGPPTYLTGRQFFVKLSYLFRF